MANIQEEPQWQRRSSSGQSRTSTLAPSGTSTTERSALTAAITKVLHDKFPTLNQVSAFEQIDKAPEERQRGITISIGASGVPDREAALRARQRPGHADYIKNMITGAAQMDGRHPGRRRD